MPEPQPTTRRDKRVLLVIGLIVLAVFAGVGIWAAVRPGSYGASGHGCITVNLPSSMGGSLVHGCGDSTAWSVSTCCRCSSVRMAPCRCSAAG